ncbi:uncharacterized protein LOC118148345 [Callithrix jacchus]
MGIIRHIISVGAGSSPGNLPRNTAPLPRAPGSKACGATSRLRICSEARKSVPLEPISPVRNAFRPAASPRQTPSGVPASGAAGDSSREAPRRPVTVSPGRPPAADARGQEDWAWGGSHAPPRPPLPGRRPRLGPVGDPEQPEALPPKPAPAPGSRWTREGAPLPQDFRIHFCPRDTRKGYGRARAPRVASGSRPCPPAPGRKLLRCPPVPLSPQSCGEGRRARRPISQQRRQQPEEARGRVPPTRPGASVPGRRRRRGGVLTAAFPNSSSAVVARRLLPGTSAATANSPSRSPRFPRFLLPLLPPAPCRPAPPRRAARVLCVMASRPPCPLRVTRNEVVSSRAFVPAREPPRCTRAAPTAAPHACAWLGGLRLECAGRWGQCFSARLSVAPRASPPRTGRGGWSGA